MELLTMPVSVLDSQEYNALKLAEKHFLIDLYVLFSDCASFTIDMERPQDYRQKACIENYMARRVAGLVASGLLNVTLRPAARKGPMQRVYSFKYRISEA